MTEGQSWTLIARVSNKDGKHWTRGDDWWTYDMANGEGKTTDPLDGMDMISPAFWLVGGNEFRITRSDDPYTALLQTTDDCLGKRTFRDKIQTSMRGKKDNQCGSSCSVEYGGQYETTEGFEQASENECSPVNLQNGNEIGFWCRRKHDEHFNSAVMMIGAGGDQCSGADHGIGIRRKDGENKARKKEDFGDKADESPTKDYSLNLWVR